MLTETSESGGSGRAAVAGFEYQIDVSVWLALDLILASRLTQEVVLEPASQEDLEAKLEDYAPGCVTSSTALDGYDLVIQAKHRSGDAWTVPGIRRLLRHGSKARQSATDRLSAPNIRYLLVTSAGLNGGTRGLQVHHPGSWPDSARMPASIVKSLPPGAAGRVAVIGSQDGERLAFRIKELLTESFRVSNARWKDCRKTLREEARNRVLGAGSGQWRRRDLEHVIRRFDGNIASSPELEHYIHPTNWNRLRSAMSKRHAALLIGQSGTGKTMATRKLYEELRCEVPGLSRVRITQGPTQLSNDQTPAPALYDIEDPWGRFDFDSASRPWNDQLAQSFADATHDRMIVATSRLDVAQSSGALESVKQWRVPLEEEHYGKPERHKLYESRIDGLPRDLQRVAANAETEVLSKLGTPLEIQKFFDALRTSDRERHANLSAFVAEAIRQAHRDSIERTVIEQIEARQEVRAAAVVWGLLQGNGKLSLRTVMKIEERLAEIDEVMIRGVRPLIGFLVAGRNLRQNEDVVTYYHPRVEAGIEGTLLRVENRLIVCRTFHHLIDVLTSLQEPYEEWGTATATKILAAIVNMEADLEIVPSQRSAARVDSWVAARLAECGRRFDMNLRIAAAAGSAASNPSELARYLLNREDQTPPDGFHRIERWERPERDEDWYARMRSDSAIRPLVETFISEILPAQHDDFPRTFALDLELVAPGLSDTFIATAKSVIDVGFIHTLSVIIEGAIRDLEGYETIVDAAVEFLSPSEEERKRTDELQLAIQNDEYPHDYADRLVENEHEREYVAGKFIEAYVERVRATTGWRHLAQHRHCQEFIFYWLNQLEKESKSGSIDIDELWSVLLRAWDDSYLNALANRVRNGHKDRDIRTHAMACLVRHARATLVAAASEMGARDDSSSQVEIAIDLAHLRDDRLEKELVHESAVLDALAMLEDPLVELSNAYLALMKGDTLDLSPEAHELLLSSSPDGGVEARRFRVSFGASRSINDDIRLLLKNAERPGIAVAALNVAIRRQMTATVRASLNHKFAAVGARALTAIGESMTAPLPERLLKMADNRGSPIRRALVALLGSKPHVAHRTTLLLLARDTYSTNAIYQGKGELPIARAAVAAIGQLLPSDSQFSEQLHAIAVDTVDPELRHAIFRLLSKAAGSAYQDQLFDLAVIPGSSDIRRAAALALLVAHEHVAPEIVARVNAALVTEQEARVAAIITLLYALRAEIPAVCQMAATLATNPGRRVLVLLIIWALRNRNSEKALTLASMLPKTTRAWPGLSALRLLSPPMISSVISATQLSAMQFSRL